MLRSQHSSKPDISFIFSEMAVKSDTSDECSNGRRSCGKIWNISTFCFPPPLITKLDTEAVEIQLFLELGHETKAFYYITPQLMPTRMAFLNATLWMHSVHHGYIFIDCKRVRFRSQRHRFFHLVPLQQQQNLLSCNVYKWYKYEFYSSRENLQHISHLKTGSPV